MDNAIQYLKQLAPIAEAIVYIAEHSAEIEGIEETLSQCKQELEAAEARLKEVDTLCSKAKDGAEQAKAQVIEAQGRIEQMIEGARAEVRRMQDQAKINLDTELRNARIKFRSEEIRLQEGIKALMAEKETLAAAVKDTRKEHDNILASMASLGRRLGAA